MINRLLSVMIVLFSTFSTSSLGMSQMVMVEDTHHGVTVLESNSKRIELEINTPEYMLSKKYVGDTEYDVIMIPNGYLTSVEGEPQLPVVSTSIGIPPGAQYELRILEYEDEPIGGEYLLSPAPQPAQIANELTPGSLAYEIYERAYRSNQLIPLEIAKISDEAWIRDQRILRIDIYPIQYNPVEGILLWHRTIKIEIDFKYNDMSNPNSLPYEGDSVFEPVLKQNLINYDSARAWRASANPPVIPGGIEVANIQLLGPRYKIIIEEDGFYRLTYENLVELGKIKNPIDVSLLRMTNQGDEIAIFVNDADHNNKFNTGDYLLFFGEEFSGKRLAQRYKGENAHWLTYPRQLPDGSYEAWKPEFNATMLEKYTDTNVYWLSWDGDPGLRMDTVSVEPGSAPSATVYTAIAHAEESNYWRTVHFTSEETWYWDEIKTTSTITKSYITDLSFPATATYSATIKGELIAMTRDSHKIRLYLNDNEYLEPIVDTSIEPYLWKGRSRYYFESEIDQTKLVSGENILELVVDTESEYQELYFDWFEIEYKGLLNALGEGLSFIGDDAGSWKYEITGPWNEDVFAVDISDPLVPKQLTDFSLAGDTISFEIEHDSGAVFYTGNPVDIDSSTISYYDPPDLTQGADYIFIAHRDFIDGIKQLADYRASQGLSTLIVDIEDLYNQFNYGIFNPIAIKNFIAFTFTKWDSPPEYVLLVGDGHWNFRGYPNYNSPPIYMPPNLVWVDPWQGEVDSANLLAAVVGDDPIADVHIGRLPVNSGNELKATINKIIAYENTPLGEWQLQYLFVADENNAAGNFIKYSESIIGDFIEPTYKANRIYVDEYQCESPCPEVHEAIIDELNNNGALFVNYIGHAAIDSWATKRVFNNKDILSLTNGDKLPVILSMDCLDGYWIHPGATGAPKPALMEEMIRASNAGAVSTFSPTGLGVATGHDFLHRGFYKAVMDQDIRELGPATLNAKLELFGRGSYFDLIHTFTIFGDPALQIQKPYQSYLPYVHK